MSRLGLRNDDTCWRCNKGRGTLFHMLYECEMVHNFWLEIITCINNILETDLSVNPAICILGMLPLEVNLSSKVYCHGLILRVDLTVLQLSVH
uniref:Reverse transcriptase zinc-binding domain-containing protein n=1 Tax=Seriola lalandi dorsalis TaxID=1841481 RepID=A0A3B4X6P7_SERLL